MYQKSLEFYFATTVHRFAVSVVHESLGCVLNPYYAYYDGYRRYKIHKEEKNREKVIVAKAQQKMDSMKASRKQLTQKPAKVQGIKPSIPSSGAVMVSQRLNP
uniref:Uncharacterized protein n=1 Tax=Macrostomum lignano TaxID=282301 RepID=A0A1I8GQE9_9PLAT